MCVSARLTWGLMERFDAVDVWFCVTGRLQTSPQLLLDDRPVPVTHLIYAMLLSQCPINISFQRLEVNLVLQFVLFLVWFSLFTPFAKQNSWKVFQDQFVSNSLDTLYNEVYSDTSWHHLRLWRNVQGGTLDHFIHSFVTDDSRVPAYLSCSIYCSLRC